MNDINKAIKEWLVTCPEIAEDKLFFNFLSLEGTNTQSFSVTDNLQIKKDICGNEIGQYTFAVIDFRPMAAMPLKFNAEDIDTAADVKKINDWIIAQAEKRNFPDFGADITVEDISVPLMPNFAGSDATRGVPVAKFIIQVTVKYFRTKEI